MQEKFDGPIFEKKSGEEAFNELCFKDILLEPAWLYLYRREFWMKNNFKQTPKEIYDMSMVLLTNTIHTML